MSSGSDTQCPECGEPIGQTATYCMHCSADLEGRQPADADGTADWADAEEGTEGAEGTSPGTDRGGQLVTGRRALIGSAVSLLGVGGVGYALLQGRTRSPLSAITGGGASRGTGSARATTVGDPAGEDSRQDATGDAATTTAAQPELTGNVTGTDAPGYVESFEEGTLDGYEQSGGPVAVDSEHVYHGDGSLHLRTNGGPTRVQTTSLDTLPSVGDTFRYRFYPRPVYSDGGANVAFALGENGSGYQIACNFWKSEFKLMRADGDSRQQLAAKDVSFEGNRWYTVEVSWGRDEIEVTLRGDGGTTLAGLTGVDDTYSKGGIRLTAWANSYQLNVHYDAIELL